MRITRLPGAALLALGMALAPACSPREDRAATDRVGDTVAGADRDTTATLGGSAAATTFEERVSELATGGMKEVELASIAAQRAANAKVKDFARRLVSDHRKANNELRQLASRNNVTLPQQLEGGQADDVQELAQRQGAEFDRAFIDRMVEDHQETVDRLQEIGEDAEANPDLKQWAGKTLPVIRQHLQTAQSLQQALETQ
ncbi:MAG TPA: DUF4142 domain-containing protein [Gemmatimonadales bacterium]|nr:DUF4142 domain-containing protein [Gemmatimonadales bacterium]